jgi:hypothetical protein
MKNLAKIILIHGKKRAGKDYFAKLLKTELELRNKSAEIMSFAEPLKEIMAVTFGISLEQLDHYKNVSKEICVDGIAITNFRKLLQVFGTEAMKPHFGDDVWVKLLREKTKESTADFVLVPDFRFKIEIISETTVKILNNNIVSGDKHSSENELNDFIFQHYVENSDYSDEINKEVTKYADYILS